MLAFRCTRANLRHVPELYDLSTARKNHRVRDLLQVGILAARLHIKRFRARPQAAGRYIGRLAGNAAQHIVERNTHPGQLVEVDIHPNLLLRNTMPGDLLEGWYLLQIGLEVVRQFPQGGIRRILRYQRDLQDVDITGRYLAHLNAQQIGR